jgi:hypothetical protein
MQRGRERVFMLLYIANIIWTLSNFIVMFNKVDPVNTLSFFSYCAIFISLATDILLGLAIAEDAMLPTPSSKFVESKIMHMPGQHRHYGA